MKMYTFWLLLFLNKHLCHSSSSGECKPSAYWFFIQQLIQNKKKDKLDQ